MSISQKKKPCKGINKAKGFPGCGDFFLNRKYGLCLACFREWCYSTGEGAEHLRKNIIPQAKKEVRKKQRAKDNEIREKIETKSQLEKRLQKEINHIVRLIDKGHPCISSGRPLGKSYDAGHFYTTKAQPSIRFNLFNIYAQSVHDNQHKSGNELEYFLRLKEVFSEEHQQYVLSLKQIDALHLAKHELKDKVSIARSIVKWLKLQDRKFTNQERLELRERFNQQIGIYQPMLAQY